MSVEDLVAGRMRACADSYQPDEAPALSVDAVVRRRRRNRRRFRVGAAVAMAAGVAAVVAVLIQPDRPTGHLVTVEPTTAIAGPGGGTLVAATYTDVDYINTQSGAIESSVPLSPPLPKSNGTWSMITTGVAVSPGTGTAYLGVNSGATCASLEVLAVDLSTGHWQVTANEAQAPAISPDGHTLAFITPAANCAFDTVTTRNLQTGATKSWKFSDSAGADNPTGLLSVAWERDGRHLLVGVGNLTSTGVELLDTSAGVGPANPQLVGPVGVGAGLTHYLADPQPGPGQQILALKPQCRPDTSCFNNPGTAVVLVDPTTGKVTSTIVADTTDRGMYPEAVVADDGSPVAVVTSQGLYRISDRRLVLLIAGVFTATWTQSP